MAPDSYVDLATFPDDHRLIIKLNTQMFILVTVGHVSNMLFYTRGPFY